MNNTMMRVSKGKTCVTCESFCTYKQEESLKAQCNLSGCNIQVKKVRARKSGDSVDFLAPKACIKWVDCRKSLAHQYRTSIPENKLDQ